MTTSNLPVHDAALAATASQMPASLPAPGLREILARVGTALFGTVSYLFFFVTLAYMIGFVGGWFVPKDIDDGTPGPVAAALAINTLLLSLFVVQHTVMARPAFKRWSSRWISKGVERSLFVFLASACLALLAWQWRPLPTVIWSAEAPWLRAAVTGLAVLGWVIVLASSFLVSHADLFGLRQSWLRAVGRAYTPVQFRKIGLYKLVRHPLMLGFLIAFWAAPTMTVGHLFFSIMTTAYILVAVFRFEEPDLVAEFGEEYRRYQREVPALVPWRRPRRA